METIQIWLIVIVSILAALIGNIVSAIWVHKKNKFFSPWLILLIIVSILVFITFGLTSKLVSLSIGTALIDSSIPAITIIIGLFLLKEIKTLSAYQICGLVLTVIGIILVSN